MELIDIKSGPSKYDLFAGLGERHRRRTVSFSGTINGVSFSAGRKLEEINVLVDGISIEDGYGESWIVSLTLVNGIPELASGTRLTGHFDTKFRKGHLKITK